MESLIGCFLVLSSAQNSKLHVNTVQVTAGGNLTNQKYLTQPNTFLHTKRCFIITISFLIQNTSYKRKVQTKKKKRCHSGLIGRAWHAGSLFMHLLVCSLYWPSILKRTNNLSPVANTTAKIRIRNENIVRI